MKGLGQHLLDEEVDDLALDLHALHDVVRLVVRDLLLVHPQQLHVICHVVLGGEEVEKVRGVDDLVEYLGLV